MYQEAFAVAANAASKKFNLLKNNPMGYFFIVNFSRNVYRFRCSISLHSRKSARDKSGS